MFSCPTWRWAILFFILILCTWSNYASRNELLQALAVAETMIDVATLWIVFWWVLVQPFSPQILLLRQSRIRCPVFKPDQLAPFSFKMFIRSSQVLTKYSLNSLVSCLALSCSMHLLFAVLLSSEWSFSSISLTTTLASMVNSSLGWFSEICRVVFNGSFLNKKI